MINVTVLEIGKISVVESTFDTAPHWNTLSLEWVEKSSDHWHSDDNVSVDIEREDAIKLIEVLQNHFKL